MDSRTLTPLTYIRSYTPGPSKAKPNPRDRGKCPWGYVV